MLTIRDFRTWPLEQLRTLLEYHAPPEQDSETWEWYRWIVEEAGNQAAFLGWHDLCQRSHEIGKKCGGEKAKVFLSACLARCHDSLPADSPVPVAETPTATGTVNSTIQERTTEEKQALAIGLLCRYPNWTRTRIAKEVGVDRRTLYNWPGFQTAWKAAKAKDPGRVVRGSKNSNGTIEAYSAVGKCASCGGIATQESEGKEYCRACYLEEVAKDQARHDSEARAPLSRFRKRNDA
jgi:hypothetical protein